MISNVMQLDMQQEKLEREQELAEQSQINELIKLMLGGEELDIARQQIAAERPHKEALIQQALSIAEKNRAPKAPDPLDQTFVKAVPGYGNMTLRQYGELPTKDKEYITYYMAVSEMGGVPKSQVEFESTDADEDLPTTAMGAAIKGYHDEHGTMPPPKVILEWRQMYGEGVKTPTPMTWQNATTGLERRFGNLDPTGKWVVTPKLRFAHSAAQRRLDELRQQGAHPLTAINQADKYGRDYQDFIEQRYNAEVDKARSLYKGKDLKAELESIKSEFYDTFGYKPYDD